MDISLHVDSCQLAAGSDEMTLRSCLVRGAETSSICPGQATATQLLHSAFRLKTFRLNREDRDRKSQQPGAWVRKARARWRSVTPHTDSLANLRAGHVGNSGPKRSDRPTVVYFSVAKVRYPRGCYAFASLPPSHGLPSEKEGTYKYSTYRRCDDV